VVNKLTVSQKYNKSFTR